MEMILTANNFDTFARAHYTNPSCVDSSEFLEDLHRFKYVRKLFRRYKDSKELKLRLILNHIIVLYNVFQPADICTKMILFKLDDYRPQVKPFLVMLNYWQEGRINGVNGVRYGSDIPLDMDIVAALRAEFSNGK